MYYSNFNFENSLIKKFTLSCTCTHTSNKVLMATSIGFKLNYPLSRNVLLGNKLLFIEILTNFRYICYRI